MSIRPLRFPRLMVDDAGHERPCAGSEYEDRPVDRGHSTYVSRDYRWAFNKYPDGWAITTYRVGNDNMWDIFYNAGLPQTRFRRLSDAISSLEIFIQSLMEETE